MRQAQASTRAASSSGAQDPVSTKHLACVDVGDSTFHTDHKVSSRQLALFVELHRGNQAYHNLHNATRHHALSGAAFLNPLVARVEMLKMG